MLGIILPSRPPLGILPRWGSSFPLDQPCLLRNDYMLAVDQWSITWNVKHAMLEWDLTRSLIIWWNRIICGISTEFSVKFRHLSLKIIWNFHTDSQETPQKFHRNSTEIPQKLHRNFTEPPQKFHGNFTETSNFLCGFCVEIPHNFLRKFVWDFHTNFYISYARCCFQLVRTKKVSCKPDFTRDKSVASLSMFCRPTRSVCCVRRSSEEKNSCYVVKYDGKLSIIW